MTTHPDNFYRTRVNPDTGREERIKLYNMSDTFNYPIELRSPTEDKPHTSHRTPRI